KLSKEKLGKLVFNNNDLKLKLESIVHPLIKEEIESAFNVYADEEAIFVSVPLLFESGLESLFDKIVFIKSDYDIRLKRLIVRNGYSKEYAKIRLAAQADQEDKAQKSDYVIENNGTKEDFQKKIEKFIESIS
nr:dephospho-CoA kinase [Cyanobacteria bacterium RUI128]